MNSLNNIKISYLVGLICIGAVLAGCTQQEEQKVQNIGVRPAKLHLVTTNQKGNLMRFVGKVRPGKEASLAFLVSGRLNQLVVREGQTVNKGDVIARLDSKDLKLALGRVQATLRELSLALNRKKKLFKQGHVAQAAVDKAQATYDSALAARDSAQRNVGYTTLKAPFNGIISKRFVENHQNIAAGIPIVQLQNLQNLEVRINVPEQVMATIRKEDVIKSEAIFEALPSQRLVVEYKEHATEADSKTQTYEVTLSLVPIEGFNILPGMTTTVEVVFNNHTKNGSLEIPVEALVSDSEGGFYIWITTPKGGKVTKQIVKVAKLGSKMATISSGLKGGETIVAAGGGLLRKESMVRPWLARDPQ
ncbi:MAG: efflux RND transporter periplasmic adaptor subunit [Magnetococcales bacterium]|nr:efflux RND transporter periplasmic adaptor subunit [Magnetococcales bacterium]